MRQLLGATVGGGARASCSGRRSGVGHSSGRRGGGGRRRRRRAASRRGGLGGLVFEFVRVVLRGRDRAAGLFDGVSERAEARCRAVSGGLAGGAFGGRFRGHRVRLDRVRDGRREPGRNPIRSCCCGAPGRAAARPPRAAQRPRDRSGTDVRAAPLRPHSAHRAQKLNAAICLGRFAPLRSMKEMSDSDGDQGPRRRPGRRRLWVLTVVLLTCLAVAAVIAATRSGSSRSTERLELHRERRRCPKSRRCRQRRSAGCAKTSPARCRNASGASTKKARCAPRSPGATKNRRRRPSRRGHAARRAMRCAGGRRTATTSSPTCWCSPRRSQARRYLVARVERPLSRPGGPRPAAAPAARAQPLVAEPGRRAAG